jgi:hypothetical protein
MQHVLLLLHPCDSFAVNQGLAVTQQLQQDERLTANVVRRCLRKSRTVSPYTNTSSSHRGSLLTRLWRRGFGGPWPEGTKCTCGTYLSTPVAITGMARQSGCRGNTRPQRSWIPLPACCKVQSRMQTCMECTSELRRRQQFADSKQTLRWYATSRWPIEGEATKGNDLLVRSRSKQRPTVISSQ